MIGRGIDQILPTPSEPGLFEPAVESAIEYVALAEAVSGPIPRRVGADYLWGDAKQAWSRLKPDARIINLETAVTANRDADPTREIHYRMHPANVSCLTAAQIDCCVLANNHVLDWGRRGLEDTLRSLQSAGLKTAGAGRDEFAASSPAVIGVGGRRLLVYGLALTSSGVPQAWKATGTLPGVNWLGDLSRRTVDAIGRWVERDRRPGDRVVLSVHWGENWGYEISEPEREFAHQLLDRAGVDLVHGHSSHHPKGIEVHRGKAILYGCGDLLNDYEGIGRYDAFRPNLSLMHFPKIDVGSGELVAMTLVPMRVSRFQLHRASAEEADWRAGMMNRECRKLGVGVAHRSDGTLALEWSQGHSRVA